MKSVTRVLLALLSMAGAAAAATPANEGISAQQISDTVKELGSDAYEGRQPGTPGGTKAASYIIGRFKKLGLEPGGAHGTWVQNVPVDLQRVAGTPHASIAVHGKALALLRNRDITVVARSRLAHVALRNVPMVFVGYGVHRPASGWDDFAGVDVRGKIIVTFAGAPTKGPKFDDFDNYASIRNKQLEAVRQGAIGMLVVDTSEKDNWETTWRQGLWPQIQIRPKAGDAPVAPDFVGSIRRGVLHDLMQDAGFDLAALEAAAAEPGFHAVPLTGMSFSGNYRMTRQSLITPTVMGRIRGTSRPDEVVIYSAHWDHLGRGPVTGYIGRNVLAPPGKDDIYNGAVDNAAGVATIMEVARAFKNGPPPERSIVFISFTEEEPGLLGSEYYTRHPVYPLENTVADLNVDTVPQRYLTQVTAIGSGKTTLEDDFAAVAGQIGLQVVSRNDGNYYRRSDHYRFALAGIPVLFIGGGGSDAEETPSSPETLAYAATYGAQHYHHVSDEWNPQWDFRGARQIAEILYGVGRRLAFSDEWPTWKPGIPFKHLHAAR